MAPIVIVTCIILAVSTMLNIGFIGKAVGHLRGPLSRKTAHIHDPAPDTVPPLAPTTSTSGGPPRRPGLAQTKLTLHLILVGLCLAVIHLACQTAYVAAYYAFYTDNSPFSRTKAQQRDKYEQARALGRLSYVSTLAEIFIRVFLFLALIAVNRLLLSPRASKANPSRVRLSRIADGVQLVTLLGLGLAFWFNVLSWRIRYQLSPVAQSLLDDGRLQNASYHSLADDDIINFLADANHTNGVYIVWAILCWMSLMTVTLTASLLRKISHSRKAGLDEWERRTLILFTKWVVPGLVAVVALRAAAVFLTISRDDISFEALLVVSLVGSLSFLVGNLVGFGMSVWATGKVVDQLLSTR